MWGKACSVGSSDVELVKINQWSFLEDSVRVCVSTWNASALWPSTCEPAPGSAVGQASRQERGVPCSAVAQQSRESASSAGAGQGDCRTVGAGQEECRTVWPYTHTPALSTLGWPWGSQMDGAPKWQNSLPGLKACSGGLFFFFSFLLICFCSLPCERQRSHS